MTLRTLAQAAVLITSLGGCKAMLNAMAESGPWGTMFRSAAAIPNPAVHGVTSPVTVRDQVGRVAYRLTTFESSKLCFEFTAPYSGDSVAKIPFAIEAAVSSADDRPGFGGREELRARDGKVRIIHTSSKVEIIEKYDSRLNAMVKNPETLHTTVAEVCFADPKIPRPESKYLLLYPDTPVGGLDGYAAWRLD
ncbi:MAG: hypothetical protein JNJ54_22295 [Myxococcaceae bacterium]|nr:hypothetical protein [Myxococcaceae bacterium]